VLDPEYTIVVVAESGQEERACRELIKTGVANVAGYMAGGYDAWIASGGQTDLIIDIDTEEFGIDYKFDEFYLIDTRTDNDYEAEHIEYAESIPLMDIEENVSVLAPTASYYIYGASFEDAAFAASLMKRNDFHILRVINVGYDELKSAEILWSKRRKPKPILNFQITDPMAFSLSSRPSLISDLSSGQFDLLVIGGGITGCGIALDAALKGMKVALIEKSDFASGTSSRSTKLIHGGLRYLKQLELKLVRDVGSERAISLQKCPPHSHTGENAAADHQKRLIGQRHYIYGPQGI
jgi:rhodanese-related sulfurtransferase